MIIFLAQAVIGFNALNHMSRLSLTHTNTHARKVLPYMRYIGTCGLKGYAWFFSHFGHKDGIAFAL